MNANSGYRYPLFFDLPTSLKVLYTNVLIMFGFGYVFGLIQIYEVHAGADNKPGLSVKDIQIAYRGHGGATRLESALRGPMSSMLPESEAAEIIAWARAGADEIEFDATVRPILQARCIGCHDGSNAALPNLTTYGDTMKVVNIDTGVSIGTLVRVSHIHLFGLTLIFAVLGLIFSHAYIKGRYIKSIVIMVPFLAIFIDIASWWLTKMSAVFGYSVIVGGALMGLSFALQWTVSFYQMWFFKCPPDKVCPVH